MRNATASEVRGPALVRLPRRVAGLGAALRTGHCLGEGLVRGRLRIEVQRLARGHRVCEAGRLHEVSWLNALPSGGATRCSAPSGAALTCQRRGGSSRVAFASRLGSVCFTRGGRAWQHSSVRPNPSFKRSANGRPPGPRGAVVQVGPRGPGVLPLPPP